MMEAWEATIEAIRLVEAGRWEDARDVSEGSRLVVLRGLIEFKTGGTTFSNVPVLRGWKYYYGGEYSAALGCFLSQDGGGWMQCWAQLGVAKIASDCGYWPHALEWSAVAWASAARGEHMDLLAEIAGARGEVLLRAGFPTLAAQAFSEDLALLPPGSRFAGRVRCYQAHALSRMGSRGAASAKLAYSLASRSSAELATRGFALAGLTLLALRLDPLDYSTPLPSQGLTGLPGFWIDICRAKVAADAASRHALIESARNKLGPYYYPEHWWLDGWQSGAVPAKPPSQLLPNFDFPEPEGVRSSQVGMPLDPSLVSVAPWHTIRQGSAPIDWWTLRDHFMP